VIEIDANAIVREESVEALFSFNLNHYRFERDLFAADAAAYKKVQNYLSQFPGNYLRYPGGLLANVFDWEGAVGEPDERRTQASGQGRPPAPVQFGPDEYFELLAATGSKPWYVLNLSGWDEQRKAAELPGEQIAASNARLVAHLRDTHPDVSLEYLQLGNELDRSIYQWPTDKYVERSKATMAAVAEENDNATYVAFLRDYDWIYKGKNEPRAGTKSRYQDFVPDVLRGLPTVSDYSLHFYYDDPDMDRRFKAIGWRLKQFRKAISVARQARPDSELNVWITEHARGVNLKMGNGMHRAELTSNVDATVSTADFLIGIAAIPEIKGAFWHGVNAGPWQLFDASVKHRDLRPTPVYWGLRVLRSVLLDHTLATEVTETAISGYSGGYDVSAVGFRDAQSSQFGVWLSNRRLGDTPAELRLPALAGQEIEIRQFALSDATSAGGRSSAEDYRLNIEPAAKTVTVGDDGAIPLTLGATSVTALEITPLD